MVVAGSVLLHATVLLALELLRGVSPLTGAVGIRAHLRMRDEASVRMKDSFHQHFSRNLHEESDSMIDLDVSRHRCERYNAAISASIIRRCGRDDSIR